MTFTEAPPRFGLGVRNADLPLLVYRGPAEFSTETDLVPVSTLPCWDVNRYYRDLGVPYPYTNASRGDIRKAYLRADGPNSARLTYVFKALLDRALRARYDPWPMGPVPFWDKYVEAEIKAAAMAEMERRGVGLDDADLLGEVFKGLGAELDEDEVDNSNGEPDDLSLPASVITLFPFSFYQWRTTYADLDRLSQWQELLIRAFAARRVKVRLTLGYMGRTPHRWSLGRVGYREVVYLHRDTEPELSVAEEIAFRMQETSAARGAICPARN